MTFFKCNGWVLGGGCNKATIKHITVMKITT